MMSAVLSMRLAPRLRHRLREAAERLGVSFSEHLRTVIEDDAMAPEAAQGPSGTVTFSLSRPAALALIQALQFCSLAYEEQLRRAGLDQGVDPEPGLRAERARVEAKVIGLVGGVLPEDGADAPGAVPPPDTLRIAPEVKALLRRRAAKARMPLSTYVVERLAKRVAPELAWAAAPLDIELVRLALRAGSAAENLAASDATIDVRPQWAKAEATARRLLGL